MTLCTFWVFDLPRTWPIDVCSLWLQCHFARTCFKCNNPPGSANLVLIWVFALWVLSWISFSSLHLFGIGHPSSPHPDFSWICFVVLNPRVLPANRKKITLVQTSSPRIQSLVDLVTSAADIPYPVDTPMINRQEPSGGTRVSSAG